MTPSWLMKALEAAAVLDLSHPDARTKLAEMIIEALPRDAMLETAIGSALAVLRVHGACGELGAVTERGVGRLADELGRNVTQGVLGALSIDMGGGLDAAGCQR